jgi:hypothetical protein
MEKTPYRQLRQIEFTVQGWRQYGDVDREAAKAYEALLRRVQRSGVVLKDYEELELAEDTRAQLRALPKVVKSLEQVRESILKASEHDLVGAVDVAHLSAELDELIARLR